MVWVLIMVIASGHQYGGSSVIQHEFSSRENCEIARNELAKLHNGQDRV